MAADGAQDGRLVTSLEDMCIKTWLRAASSCMVDRVNHRQVEVQEFLAGVLREVLGGVCSTNIRMKMMEALVDVRFLIDLCRNFARVSVGVNKVIVSKIHQIKLLSCHNQLVCYFITGGSR